MSRIVRALAFLTLVLALSLAALLLIATRFDGLRDPSGLALALAAGAFLAATALSALFALGRAARLDADPTRDLAFDVALRISIWASLLGVTFALALLALDVLDAPPLDRPPSPPVEPAHGPTLFERWFR